MIRHSTMASLALFTLSFVVVSPSRADEQGKLIFQDDFERNESQEVKDEVGNGWATNSNSRAGGNKQVDLKNGVMYITMHPTADHAVSVRHDAEFTNGTVSLRFMLENPKDTLGLDFADLQCKTVHAGHLFKITIGTNKLEIMDSKTGVMDLRIHTLKKEKKLTPELQEQLKSKKKLFPNKLEAGKWYSLKATVSGDTVNVAIDGEQVGSFSSEGFAHPTKRMLRLSVPRQAVVDDVKIFRQ